jgi:hypothetical protein
MINPTTTPPEASFDELHPDWALTNKLSQLRAMLLMTYGEARETFTNMSDTTQDNYLWACADLAGYCIEMDNRCAARRGGQAVPCVTPCPKP